MIIDFSKYQATGNDFVLLDNRDQRYNSLTQQQVARLCDRRFGIGGDGLMLLNAFPGYDFEMKYFNADGAPGSMCGNGGRCITAFAHRCGILLPEYRFLAFDGEHLARIQNGLVSLHMNPVNAISEEDGHLVLDTGSPHCIVSIDKADEVDVITDGRRIRNSENYIAEGINVNFVERIAGDTLYVRTYERGVEDETFSCGTGVTAAAIASAGGRNGQYNFHIRTRGGDLTVGFHKTANAFEDIWLTGPAEFVFSGEINL